MAEARERGLFRRRREVEAQPEADTHYLESAGAGVAAAVLLDLRTCEVDPETLHSVDSQRARAERFFPLYRRDGKTYVAVEVPSVHLTERVKRALGNGEVVLEPVSKSDLDWAFDQYYSGIEAVDQEAGRAVAAGLGAVDRDEGIDITVDEAPVVRIVRLLIMQGLRDRASDIHVEPQDDVLLVRFRVDGSLRDVMELPLQLARPVAIRIKLLAEMDIVNRHGSQDGQITMEVDGRPLDIRVSTVETLGGEKLVLRLLDRSRSILPLAGLGLPAGERETLNRLVHAPYGLVAVTGPTGAGKTTTLYAALNELDRKQRNITTIEDPAEYRFRGINQIQINRKSDLTFANGLRAILRQDPDVIMVGEVRDVETARIAVQAALTGHLVLCSMHATDAVGAIHRFLDMEIEPYLVASALTGVIAQRLVRLVCPGCRRMYGPSPAEVAFYTAVAGHNPKSRLWRGAGCPKCGGTGLFERSGVFESMEINDPLRELIMEKAPLARFREVIRGSGVKSMQEAAVELVDQGKTTLEQVMKTVYAISG